MGVVWGTLGVVRSSLRRAGVSVGRVCDVAPDIQADDDFSARHHDWRVSQAYIVLASLMFGILPKTSSAFFKCSERDFLDFREGSKRLWKDLEKTIANRLFGDFG